jgi:uncharacterized protein (TIGR02186 family)
MKRLFLALLLTLLTLAPARAEESVVAGLSQNHVAITATFVGSEILIFGAVKRDAPAPEDDGPLGVVVVVEGPSSPQTVRLKERRMGIWVNTESVEVDLAPSFYAVSTSAPFDDVIRAEDDLRHHVSIPQSIRLVGESSTSHNVADFAKALIRIRTGEGLFAMHEGDVEVREDTLFSTRIALPANLTEGEYHARIFLTRGGHVISDHDARIDVRKVGIERWLYTMAHEQALLYGIMSLVIAVFSGWAASAVFRIFQRG